MGQAVRIGGFFVLKIVHRNLSKIRQVQIRLIQTLFANFNLFFNQSLVLISFYKFPVKNMSNLNNSKNQVLIIGMAVMGKNFAKNFASKGVKTAVYNRSFNKTEELLAEKNPNLEGFADLKDAIDSLELPRKIFLLVKSGEATDETIEQIIPFLDENDILVDCGNSHWKDTQRRQKYLESKNIEFVGSGISGGSEGALHGPSLMPSGKKEVVDHLLPFLEKVAATDFSGRKCVTNVGNGASGHFVKMVHNGIEYAIMQGIAEIYDILRYNSYSNEEIHNVFAELNQGELKSFLLDITVKIFETKDNFGEENSKTKPNLIFDIYGVIWKDDGQNNWIEKTKSFIEQNSHKYNFYYLSNLSPNQLVEFVKSDVYKYFSGGYGSCQIGVEKPNPLAFQQLLRSFNLKEAIFIDNEERNLEMARNFGLKTILFDSLYTDILAEIKGLLGIKGLLDSQENKSYLLDKIKDQAGANGTGSWTVESALELGVAVPTIAAAVFARSMSVRNQSFNKEIFFKNKKVNNNNHLNQEDLISTLKYVLKSVFTVSYLQGLDLIVCANEIYKWQVDILEVCRIWQGGCIIRSEMLKDLNEYFMENKKLDIEFHQLQQSISFINFSTLTPKPVIHSTFDYIFSITNKNLPTNLIQAQRDYFGSHTYKRIDKEGDFTGGWL